MNGQPAFPWITGRRTLLGASTNSSVSQTSEGRCTTCTQRERLAHLTNCGTPDKTRSPRLEIMFDHQFSPEADHHRIRIHVPSSALHRLHNLHHLLLCLHIHAPPDLVLPASSIIPPNSPMLRPQNQPRRQNVFGPFLRRYLPEHQHTYGSRVVQWENNVVRCTWYAWARPRE
jgi:hypothetical protein